MENKELNILTDESIVKMAQEGSSTAYEYLINKYRGLAKVKSKKYFITGADHEDVIQEGMIGIFKAVRDFDPEKDASFRTFAEICISRQITTAINNANRKKHQILNESVSLNYEDEREDETNTMIDRFAATGICDNPEDMTIFREAIECLEEDRQDIFSSFEKSVLEEMLEGHGYREIAENLKKPSKSVDNAIQRIRKKMQNYIEIK